MWMWNKRQPHNTHTHISSRMWSFGQATCGCSQTPAAAALFCCCTNAKAQWERDIHAARFYKCDDHDDDEMTHSIHGIPCSIHLEIGADSVSPERVRSYMVYIWFWIVCFFPFYFFFVLCFLCSLWCNVLFLFAIFFASLLPCLCYSFVSSICPRFVDDRVHGYVRLFVVLYARVRMDLRSSVCVLHWLAHRNTYLTHNPLLTCNERMYWEEMPWPIANDVSDSFWALPPSILPRCSSISNEESKSKQRIKKKQREKGNE